MYVPYQFCFRPWFEWWYHNIWLPQESLWLPYFNSKSVDIQLTLMYGKYHVARQ